VDVLSRTHVVVEFPRTLVRDDDRRGEGDRPTRTERPTPGVAGVVASCPFERDARSRELQVGRHHREPELVATGFGQVNPDGSSSSTRWRPTETSASESRVP
jgi:hypothetical protein